VYTNHGFKSTDLRRHHAPSTRNGTSTTEQTITANCPAARTRPPNRFAAIVPSPWSRKRCNEGSAVMLFHSSIVRIQSA
jgi:hypothetical protein